VSTVAKKCAVPVIDPYAVFTLGTLQATLGLRDGSLPREIRQKRLRARKRCGRYFILGSDVIQWLTSSSGQEGQSTSNGMRRSATASP
jgi:hypothetical protein